MSRNTEDSAAYRQMRRKFLATDDTCWLCHHSEANQVDHVIPRAVRTERLETWNWRPAHGPPGCPTCGRCCNQERGTKPTIDRPAWVTSPDW